MNPMKRVGLVALLFLLAAFFAASPVFAGESILLVPPEGAPEPDAYGKATLTRVKNVAILRDVKVQCQNLTPGDQYDVIVWFADGGGGGGAVVTAYGHGQLSVTLRRVLYMGGAFEVGVVNAQGEVVLWGW